MGRPVGPWKPLGTLRFGTPAPGAGKSCLAASLPERVVVPGVPEMLPQVEYSGPYRPKRREPAIPETGNLSCPGFISLAGLDGEKEKGL